jgi:hypothetical protein
VYTVAFVLSEPSYFAYDLPTVEGSSDLLAAAEITEMTQILVNEDFVALNDGLNDHVAATHRFIVLEALLGIP